MSANLLHLSIFIAHPAKYSCLRQLQKWAYCHTPGDLYSLRSNLPRRLPFLGGVLTPAVAGGHIFLEALKVRGGEIVSLDLFASQLGY